MTAVKVMTVPTIQKNEEMADVFVPTFAFLCPGLSLAGTLSDSLDWIFIESNAVTSSEAVTSPPLGGTPSCGSWWIKLKNTLCRLGVKLKVVFRMVFLIITPRGCYFIISLFALTGGRRGCSLAYWHLAATCLIRDFNAN